MANLLQVFFVLCRKAASRRWLLHIGFFFVYAEARATAGNGEAAGTSNFLVNEQAEGNVEDGVRIGVGKRFR